MATKITFLILFLTTYLLVNGQVKGKVNFINPTGSYHFDNKTIIKNGERYGYFGELKIKLLDNSKIAISFFICKGAPAYTSGSFIDTLKYQKNQAIYKTTEDSTCKIIFIFDNRGTTIKQYQTNLNNGCGLGHGVFADGFYKKTSSKIPKMKDLNSKQNGK